jgi:hypothetical protein
VLITTDNEKTKINTMKAILLISFIFSLTSFIDVNGQTKRMTRYNKKLIDTTNVEYITISGGWTSFVNNKRLSRNQVKLLAEKWNSAQEIKTIKPMNEFRVDIYSKKGKRRTLSVAGQLITENGKVWYNLVDINFIKELLLAQHQDSRDMHVKMQRLSLQKIKE